MAAERPVASPPLLLAVESSCRTQSVALWRGGRIVAEAAGPSGRTGAESLLPCIDAVLGQARVGLEAVEAFAVSIGPGSFTGLRVGVATLKGLAFGGDWPVAPVPTLAALARGAGRECGALPDEPVVALLDARRGEVYAAGWRLEGPLSEAVATEPREGVYTPDELAALLPGQAWLVGEGLALCADRLLTSGREGLRLGPALEPHARDVAALGSALIERGDGLGVDALLPRYVRRAEAEVKRTGRRFED